MCFTDRGESVQLLEGKKRLTGNQIVDVWYRERRLYHFSQPRWQKGIVKKQ